MQDYRAELSDIDTEIKEAIILVKEHIMQKAVLKMFQCSRRAR